MINVFDFDGVVCDSIRECRRIAWYAFVGGAVADFGIEVPDRVRERFGHQRPFMRQLAHFIVPLLDGPEIADRASFDARCDELAAVDTRAFTAAADAYRAAVRGARRAEWLACHDVHPEVVALLDGAYIATARDGESVLELLAAHGVRMDPERIFASLTSKTGALAEIAGLEGVDPAGVQLIDDSVVNCLAARKAKFGAAWASWGYGAPGDEAIARDDGIPVLKLADAPGVAGRYRQPGDRPRRIGDRAPRGVERALRVRGDRRP